LRPLEVVGDPLQPLVQPPLGFGERVGERLARPPLALGELRRALGTEAPLLRGHLRDRVGPLACDRAANRLDVGRRLLLDRGAHRGARRGDERVGVGGHAS